MPIMLVFFDVWLKKDENGFWMNDLLLNGLLKVVYLIMWNDAYAWF